MPAFFAAISCGWSTRGSGAPWSMIRSGFWAMAWFTPAAHCDGCAWFV